MLDTDGEDLYYLYSASGMRSSVRVWGMIVVVSEQSLFSVAEAAVKLSLSPWTIRAHVRRGTIKVTRCGRRVLIAKAELERIAAEGLPHL